MDRLLGASHHITAEAQEFVAGMAVRIVIVGIIADGPDRLVSIVLVSFLNFYFKL